jgi:hypothetical protein
MATALNFSGAAAFSLAMVVRVVAPVWASTFQNTRNIRSSPFTKCPARASCWVFTPTPAAAESPRTSRRSGLPTPDSPKRSPSASGSFGVTRRTYFPWHSKMGAKASIAAVRESSRWLRSRMSWLSIKELRNRSHSGILSSPSKKRPAVKLYPFKERGRLACRARCDRSPSERSLGFALKRFGAEGQDFRDNVRVRFLLLAWESAGPFLRGSPEAAFPARSSIPGPCSPPDGFSSGCGCSPELRKCPFHFLWE